jgi:hypothetical protein
MSIYNQELLSAPGALIYINVNGCQVPVKKGEVIDYQAAAKLAGKEDDQHLTVVYRLANGHGSLVRGEVGVAAEPFMTIHAVRTDSA